LTGRADVPTSGLNVEVIAYKAVAATNPEECEGVTLSPPTSKDVAIIM
jgi:hypothetical protein